MAPKSEVFAVEGFLVLDQVASGLVLGSVVLGQHSRLEFEVSRVWYLK